MIISIPEVSLACNSN